MRINDSFVGMHHKQLKNSVDDFREKGNVGHGIVDISQYGKSEDKISQTYKASTIQHPSLHINNESLSKSYEDMDNKSVHLSHLPLFSGNRGLDSLPYGSNNATASVIPNPSYSFTSKISPSSHWKQREGIENSIPSYYTTDQSRPINHTERDSLLYPQPLHTRYKQYDDIDFLNNVNDVNHSHWIRLSQKTAPNIRNSGVHTTPIPLFIDRITEKNEAQPPHVQNIEQIFRAGMLHSLEKDAVNGFSVPTDLVSKIQQNISEFFVRHQLAQAAHHVESTQIGQDKAAQALSNNIKILKDILNQSNTIHCDKDQPKSALHTQLEKIEDFIHHPHDIYLTRRSVLC